MKCESALQIRPGTALDAFQRVRDQIGEPAMVNECDCISRRMEFEASGLVETMGGIMKQNPGVRL